jgi:hypothetical protein
MYEIAHSTFTFGQKTGISASIWRFLPLQLLQTPQKIRDLGHFLA